VHGFSSAEAAPTAARRNSARQYILNGPELVEDVGKDAAAMAQVTLSRGAVTPSRQIPIHTVCDDE